jgi:hypothetical protein
MVGLGSKFTPTWAAQRETVHMDSVPLYVISISADHTGFDVEVIEPDGSCQMIRGFKTMTDAHACIARNRLLANGVYLGEPSGFRTSP